MGAGRRISDIAAAALLATAAGAAAGESAVAADWARADAGEIAGLVDLRASPHTDSGLVALVAEEGWRAVKVTEPDGALATDGQAPFMGKLAPLGIIPDGRVGVSPVPPPPKDAPEAGEVPTAAWYEDEARRYDHGVLGDTVEGGSLQVAYADRRILGHKLDDTAVFEDLEPRIVDADGDGAAHEVLAIRTSLEAGAALALYGQAPDADRVRELATSAPLGAPNRWLNPAGVADYDGDGAPEIAAVHTPHIGGELVHYAWDGESTELVAERRVSGYSNHAAGSLALGLSATVDWNDDGRPELVLPRDDRRQLAVVAFRPGDADSGEEAGFTELARFEHAAPVATSLARADLDVDGRPEIVYGLENGAIRVLRRAR